MALYIDQFDVPKQRVEPLPSRENTPEIEPAWSSDELAADQSSIAVVSPRKSNLSSLDDAEGVEQPGMKELWAFFQDRQNLSGLGRSRAAANAKLSKKRKSDESVGVKKKSAAKKMKKDEEEDDDDEMMEVDEVNEEEKENEEPVPTKATRRSTDLGGSGG